MIPPAYDQFGNPFATVPVSTAQIPPNWTSPIGIPDPRDMELSRLRSDLYSKEISLREAYMEIGRLHEEVRNLIAFKEFAANTKANPLSVGQARP